MSNSLKIVNSNREMQEYSDKIHACRSSSLSVRACYREFPYLLCTIGKENFQ